MSNYSVMYLVPKHVYTSFQTKKDVVMRQVVPSINIRQLNNISDPGKTTIQANDIYKGQQRSELNSEVKVMPTPTPQDGSTNTLGLDGSTNSNFGQSTSTGLDNFGQMSEGKEYLSVPSTSVPTQTMSLLENQKDEVTQTENQPEGISSVSSLTQTDDLSSSIIPISTHSPFPVNVLENDSQSHDATTNTPQTTFGGVETQTDKNTSDVGVSTTNVPQNLSVVNPLSSLVNIPGVSRTNISTQTAENNVSEKDTQTQQPNLTMTRVSGTDIAPQKKKKTFVETRTQQPNLSVARVANIDISPSNTKAGSEIGTQTVRGQKVKPTQKQILSKDEDIDTNFQMVEDETLLSKKQVTYAPEDGDKDIYENPVPSTSRPTPAWDFLTTRTPLKSKRTKPLGLARTRQAKDRERVLQRVRGEISTDPENTSTTVATIPRPSWAFQSPRVFNNKKNVLGFTSPLALEYHPNLKRKRILPITWKPKKSFAADTTEQDEALRREIKMKRALSRKRPMGIAQAKREAEELKNKLDEKAKLLEIKRKRALSRKRPMGIAQAQQELERNEAKKLENKNRAPPLDDDDSPMPVIERQRQHPPPLKDDDDPMSIVGLSHVKMSDVSGRKARRKMSAVMREHDKNKLEKKTKAKWITSKTFERVGRRGREVKTKKIKK